MRKFLLFMACVILGIMTSACVLSDYTVGEYEDFEYSCGYAENTDDTYLSWIKSEGKEFTVEIEYVSLRKDEPYVTAKRVNTVPYFGIQKVRKGARLEEDLVFENYEYQVDIISDGVEFVKFYTETLDYVKQLKNSPYILLNI